MEHYELQLWSDFTFFEHRCGAAPNPNLPCDQFEQWENRNLVGTKLAHGWYHGLFGHESTTEVGVQVRHDEIHVGLNNTQARTVFERVRDDFVSETATGLYVKNSTVWTPWLRSLAGLRADRVDLDVDAQLTPQNSGTANGQKLSPKLSLIFGPWAKTEFFANAGKGFHSNDARGVTQTLDPTDGLAAPPVPALVSAWGAELGARTAAIPDLQSAIAFWTIYSDSEIQYNPDSTIGSTTPNGASRRYGVEWSNHWAATRWLLFDLDLAAPRRTISGASNIESPVLNAAANRNTAKDAPTLRGQHSVLQWRVTAFTGTVADYILVAVNYRRCVRSVAPASQRRIVGTLSLGQSQAKGYYRWPRMLRKQARTEPVPQS